MPATIMRMIAHHDETKPHTVPIIALLTDFGIEDSYVGVMKGVILSICPTVQIIDLTHAVQPQNVRQAAYALLSAYAYMPSQTIFVVVVDPGVGSSRKPVAIQTNRGIFIGPDNGLFSYVLKHLEVQQIVALQNPQYALPFLSNTFHGRDIFSPAAAHLANGVPFDQLGTALTKLEWLAPPRFEVHANAIHGEVVYIDHFGNLATSIGRLTWDKDDMLSLVPFFEPTTNIHKIHPEHCSIEIRGQIINSLSLTFAAVSKGEFVALINSAGNLEIAVNQGNAAQDLQVSVGNPVTLHIER